jgi:hypothetical protein
LLLFGAELALLANLWAMEILIGVLMVIGLLVAALPPRSYRGKRPSDGRSLSGFDSFPDL